MYSILLCTSKTAMGRYFGDRIQIINNKPGYLSSGLDYESDDDDEDDNDDDDEDDDDDDDT